MIGRRSQALRGQRRLHPLESILEFPVRVLQSLLRIDLHLAPHVGEREEEVTELLTHRGGVCCAHGRLHLLQLLVHLGEKILPIGPVEPDPRRLRRDAQRLQQRRQRSRHTRQERTAAPAGALVGLDLLPLLQDLGGGGQPVPAEDVRVPAYDFVGNATGDVVKTEVAPLPRYLRLEDHLEQEVTQFLAELSGRALRDRLESLIRLLEKVGPERFRRLLAIPGASVRAPQMLDDAAQTFHLRHGILRVAIARKKDHLRPRAVRAQRRRILCCPGRDAILRSGLELRERRGWGAT